MKIIPHLLLGVILAAGTSRAELIANGDFEQPIDVGWSNKVLNAAGSASFEWSDTLGQPGGTHAARVYKYLASYASLYQTVDVPGPELMLNFDGRFRIGAGSSTCWPVAALILRYQDAEGNELGNTKFVLHNEFCTWANSDTAHLIEIERPEEWSHHTLDIAQELRDNLPGVPTASLAKLTLELYAYDNGT